MPGIAFDILIVALLILINGVLSMCEIAVVTSRPARLEARASSGSHGARTALALRNDPSRVLSTTQIGITLVAILAGAFGGATLSEPLGDQLDKVSWIEPYGQQLAVAIVVALITYFSLVIGELVPKRIGLRHPEGVAILFARSLTFLASAVRPLVAVLALSTDFLLRVIGIRDGGDEVVTEEEIRVMVEQSSAAGVLEEGERDVINRALVLADRTAGELMTPRTQTDWLDLEDSPDELSQRVRSTQRSWLPVARGDLDDPLGVIAIRDVLSADRDAPVHQSIESAIRPGHFVPEGASALGMLELFKRTSMPIALVVDEYGGVQGVVTVTDVLEALVGDIGPVEEEEPGIMERADGSLLVDGLYSIDDFKERMGMVDELPDEPQFQTVAGFVLSRLGHIPTAGEYFAYEDLTFEVMDMDGARVDKVLVARAPDGDENGSS